MFFLFFFNDTATTEIYTLSLHDALPISDNRTVTDNVDREKITTSKTLEKNDSSTMGINTFSFDGTEMKSYVKKSGDSTYSTNSRRYDPRQLGFMTPVEDQQSLDRKSVV